MPVLCDVLTTVLCVLGDLTYITLNTVTMAANFEACCALSHLCFSFHCCRLSMHRVWTDIFWD